VSGASDSHSSVVGHEHSSAFEQRRRECNVWEELPLELSEDEGDSDSKGAETLQEWPARRWSFWVERHVKGELYWHIHVRIRGVVPHDCCAVLEPSLGRGDFKDELVSIGWLTDGITKVRLNDPNLWSDKFPMFVLIREAVENKEKVILRPIDMVVRLQALNECVSVLPHVPEVTFQGHSFVTAGVAEDRKCGLLPPRTGQRPCEVVERGAQIVQTVTDYWRPREWRLLADLPNERVTDGSETARANVIVVDLFDGYVRIIRQKSLDGVEEAVQVILRSRELPLPTRRLPHPVTSS
jgi:hypothetical protein